MKFNLKKLGVTAGLLGVMAGPMIGLAATQAGAIPPVAHPNQDLESAGSDTTYWATAAIDAAYNANTTGHTAINSDADHVGAIPPIVSAPFPTSYSTVGDANCAATTYDSGNVPPNGSGAGISALVADGGTGCIDYARSSRGRKGGDASNLDFWAFGLDALGLGDFPKSAAFNPTGTYAPAKGLTQTQIIQIYTCDPSTGAPYISDWKQINPALAKKPGTFPIKKYAPQTSSGSYSFFNSQILSGGTIDAGCDSSHLSTFIEEHFASHVAPADKPYAVFPMSYAQWIAMAHGVQADIRGGVAEMGISTDGVKYLKPSSATVNECRSACPKGHFLGTRYVYNVTIPTEPDYTDVLRLVGADNSGAGFICSGKATSIIQKFGFRALLPATTGTTSSGTNVTLASKCRVNPTPL